MTEEEEDQIVQFSEMGLDGRLLKSVADLGWSEPTLIQEKAIPLAMEGKDILARGRTGCGKTGAFLIPVLAKIIEAKRTKPDQAIRAIVLAPSKELTAQIASHCAQLNKYTANEVSCVDIGSKNGPDMKPLLADKPDIVVTTPSKLLYHVKNGNITDLKSTIQFLIIDEADLMFSFGYENDIKEILDEIVPDGGVQSFLVSATLNPDVASLKKLVLKNAITLKLEESDLPDSELLTQYHVTVEEPDKFVVINALFKLNLIRGRTIIFVSSVDRCYKLKLFLEQFGVRTCVLNSELPVASRCHVVSQFNQGQYDILIAADDKCLEDPTKRQKEKQKSKRNEDKEYGVSRGIDFQFVSNVINFDFPDTVESYVHRVGRTARGARNSEGTALSFISKKELPKFEQVKEKLDKNANFKPYQFKMEELDAFKYRTNDALRAVTSIAIREARLKEIKRELLLSNKLGAYFKEHPKDLKVLRHDRALHTVKHQEHFKHVPEYIVPPVLKGLVQAGSSKRKRDGDDGSSLATVSHTVKRKRTKSSHSNSNPLKSFTVSEGRGNRKRK